MGDARARPQGLACRQHLPHDLTRGQVALEPHGAREAEGAAETAAHLRRHAEGEPVFVGHEDRLDAGAILEPEDELLAAIQRWSPPLDLRQGHLCLLAEGPPELEWQIGHGPDVRGALGIEPGGDLAPPVARGAQRLTQLLELQRRKVEQIQSSHCRSRIAQDPTAKPA